MSVVYWEVPAAFHLNITKDWTASSKLKLTMFVAKHAVFEEPHSLMSTEYLGAKPPNLEKLNPQLNSNH